MLIIEICPIEPRATAYNPNEFKTELQDCTRSGDASQACNYIRDQIGVEFRRIARDETGNYVNRLATDEELRETCRAIYFESSNTFEDLQECKTYLIWDCANSEEFEG